MNLSNSNDGPGEQWKGKVNFTSRPLKSQELFFIYNNVQIIIDTWVIKIIKLTNRNATEISNEIWYNFVRKVGIDETDGSYGIL